MSNIQTIVLLLMAFLLYPLQAAHSGTGAPGIDEKPGGLLPGGLVFVKEDGESATLKDLIDRPSFITFSYYGCSGVCPAVFDGIAKLIKNEKISGEDFRVITVSMNENETPHDANRKKSSFAGGLPPGKWLFLTGTKDNIDALAGALGFGFMKQGDGYIHPGALIAVSPGRKIVRYLYGSTFVPADVQMALLEAREERPGPSIPKALLFCFRYDPASRAYVLDGLRLTGLGVLFAAASFFIYVTRKRPTER